MIFDSLKSYVSEWTETSVRKFTEEECAAVKQATVVASGWGLSVCFLINSCKKYIPLEPSTKASAGDALDVHDLKIVNLTYNGDDSAITKRNILRVRIEAKVEELSFDNPFGL